MPIGKDSITKRVAKTATEEKIAPELVATVAAAPAPKKTPSKKPIAQEAQSAPAKKTSPTKKTASTTKKPAAAAEPKTEKKVDTAVLSNISPETVKAVIGHEENKGFEKTQIGEKMPVHLL